MLDSQPHTQSHSKRNSKNNKHNDKQAPPLESVSAPSVLIRLLDFNVSTIDILRCLIGIDLRLHDIVFLNSHDLRHVRKHSRQVCKSLLNALQLVVTGTYGAEDRRSLA